MSSEKYLIVICCILAGCFVARAENSYRDQLDGVKEREMLEQLANVFAQYYKMLRDSHHLSSARKNLVKSNLAALSEQLNELFADKPEHMRLIKSMVESKLQDNLGAASFLTESKSGEKGGKNAYRNTFKWGRK